MARIPKLLAKEWREKLADSGFSDIEDDKGRLKSHNTRTSIYETRDATAAFYGLVDAYLTTAQLTRLERRILELYSNGEHIKNIAFDVYRSDAYVKNCIYKHRDIILNKKN